MPRIDTTRPLSQVEPFGPGGDLQLRRTRRIASGAIAFAGALDVASALTPPFTNRLAFLLRLVPLAVPRTASALVVLFGLILLGLGQGVRRGQRRAWVGALCLMVASTLLHVVKGVDVEEAVMAMAVSVYLVRHRAAFRGGADGKSFWVGAGLLAAGALTASALGALAIGLSDPDRPDLRARQAAMASVERIVGLRTVTVPAHLDLVLAPALATVGAVVAVTLGWLAFRPVRRPATASADARIARARSVVRAHGGDTLAYFALRDDKEWFFHHDSLVAYGRYGSVCLVSPDPIGPLAERAEVWHAFRRFTDSRGWTVGVMGGSADWLSVYETSGMTSLYIGDEAVIDCTTFALDGGTRKKLRQAVNRVEQRGYTMRFCHPSELDAGLRAQLEALLAASRGARVERGFSMTLGRAFHSGDDVLLAMALDPMGRPAAFCQYVPSPGISGFSLDLMVRNRDDSLNGLTDFVIVRSIQRLGEQGHRGLALNFSTLRTIVSGESGDSLSDRVARRVLLRLSGSMQIESLWRYNRKFGPSWQPRYALYDGPENLLATALAVARAESWWELPVVGRFLVPSASDARQY